MRDTITYATFLKARYLTETLHIMHVIEREPGRTSDYYEKRMMDEFYELAEALGFVLLRPKQEETEDA